MVAFTSAGRGMENDLITFFSQELVPTKPPQNIDFVRLSPTSLNITWTPLTLFEARGFPSYTVTLRLPSNGRRRRQSPPLQITNNSFAVFTGLMDGATYDLTVGVLTGNASRMLMPDEIMSAPSITGSIFTCEITQGSG